MRFVQKRDYSFENTKSNGFENGTYEKCRYCIAYQCAPVLVYIKPSNLLIVKSEICRKLKSDIIEAKANYKLLYKTDNKYIYLIYRKKALEHLFSIRKNADYLSSIGYEKYLIENDIDAAIDYLALRLEGALEKKQDFPHEMGIFMGYPLEDVLGFINNKGNNYQLSGYWKVYKNKDVAIRLFKQYDLARNMALNLIKKGEALSSLCAAYVRAYSLSQRYGSKTLVS